MRLGLFANIRFARGLLHLGLCINNHIVFYDLHYYGPSSCTIAWQYSSSADWVFWSKYVCRDRLQGIPHFIAKHFAYQQQSETQYLMLFSLFFGKQGTWDKRCVVHQLTYPHSMSALKAAWRPQRERCLSRRLELGVVDGQGTSKAMKGGLSSKWPQAKSGCHWWPRLDTWWTRGRLFRSSAI